MQNDKSFSILAEVLFYVREVISLSQLAAKLQIHSDLTFQNKIILQHHPTRNEFNLTRINQMHYIHLHHTLATVRTNMQ